MTYHDASKEEARINKLKSHYAGFQAWIRSGPAWDNRKSYIFEKKADGDYFYPEMSGLFKAWIAGREHGYADAKNEVTKDPALL